MTKRKRPSRWDTFMTIAYTFAERSTCQRGNVGVVIVQGTHIVAHGYNGAPPGEPHCDNPNVTGCNPKGDSCQRAIHAEANAIAYAARKGVKCDGAKMFTTHQPCEACARLIVASGISEVIYHQPYHTPGQSLLGVRLRKWKDPRS